MSALFVWQLSLLLALNFQRFGMVAAYKMTCNASWSKESRFAFKYMRTRTASKCFSLSALRLLLLCSILALKLARHLARISTLPLLSHLNLFCLAAAVFYLWKHDHCAWSISFSAWAERFNHDYMRIVSLFGQAELSSPVSSKRAENIWLRFQEDLYPEAGVKFHPVCPPPFPPPSNLTWLKFTM